MIRAGEVEKTGVEAVAESRIAEVGRPPEEGVGTVFGPRAGSHVARENAQGVEVLLKTHVDVVAPKSFGTNPCRIGVLIEA